MNTKLNAVVASITLALAGASGTALGAAFVQCPGDTNGDAIIDDPLIANTRCMHITGSDGFIEMADGKLQYIFGFGDYTGRPEADTMTDGILFAEHTSPTIVLKQDEKFYLTLSNPGMVYRPDLFDAHTVHYHGFPNASSYFDGVPENTNATAQGASLTYFYNNVEPGTYLYHCHVEATEHMQMGMMGNLYVQAAQNGLGYAHSRADGMETVYTHFAYNDGDGSTGYNREYPLQLTTFDPEFHDASVSVQPLPFARMYDRYSMINGRGYPDTVRAAPQDCDAITAGVCDAGAHTRGHPDWDYSTFVDAMPTPIDPGTGDSINRDKLSQKLSAKIVADKGERILLRVSNLSITEFLTISALGLPMEVVGQGAKQLKGPGTEPELLYFNTNSITLGGGSAQDVIIDTSDPRVHPGTYFLYTNNLRYLSNNTQDYGGLMTEIVIN